MLPVESRGPETASPPTSLLLSWCSWQPNNRLPYVYLPCVTQQLLRIHKMVATERSHGGLWFLNHGQRFIFPLTNLLAIPYIWNADMTPLSGLMKQYSSQGNWMPIQLALFFNAWWSWWKVKGTKQSCCFSTLPSAGALLNLQLWLSSLPKW